MPPPSITARRLAFGALALLGALALTGALAAPNDAGEPVASGCYVWLFDGENFDRNDDNIRVDGPAEYANLKELPNAGGKDWNDEADSFAYGAGTIVTLWEDEDFKDLIGVYDDVNGGRVNEDVDSNYDEPSSMKIECRT